jgi:hypothetical protein
MVALENPPLGRWLAFHDELDNPIRINRIYAQVGQPIHQPAQVIDERHGELL